MPRPGRIHRRFFASTRGVAAVEFALIFPMLLVLLLASIDGGRAVAISMKVRSASFALDAMANQYSAPIQDTDMQGLLGPVLRVFDPYPSAPAAVTLSQIRIAAGGQATVAWSDTLNGTAHTPGATITVPSNLTTTTAPNNACATYPCYVLLAEVNYTYTPMFGNFIAGPFHLSDKLYVTPRNVACIVRNTSCYLG